MRKSIATLVAVILFCSCAFTQTTKNKGGVGFKAGLNMSSFRRAVPYSTYEADVKAGGVVGVFVDIPVYRRIRFQPEFLYSQMGAKAFDAAQGHKTLFYNYFSVPLLVKYSIVPGWNLIAGPQLDFLIRARERDYVNHTTTVTNDIKDFDFAYTAGFEFWFSKKIVAEARYIHGSQDISTTPGGNTLFNQGVQVSIGWKLFKKAKKPKK